MARRRARGPRRRCGPAAAPDAASLVTGQSRQLRDGCLDGREGIELGLEGPRPLVRRLVEECRPDGGSDSAGVGRRSVEDPSPPPGLQRGGSCGAGRRRAGGAPTAGRARARPSGCPSHRARPPGAHPGSTPAWATYCSTLTWSGCGPSSAGSTSVPTVTSTSAGTSASPARRRSNRSPESALKTVPRVTYTRLPAARGATSEGRKENVAGTSAAGSRNEGGNGESTRPCA